MMANEPSLHIATIFWTQTPHLRKIMELNKVLETISGKLSQPRRALELELHGDKMPLR